MSGVHKNSKLRNDERIQCLGFLGFRVVDIGLANTLTTRNPRDPMLLNSHRVNVGVNARQDFRRQEDWTGLQHRPGPILRGPSISQNKRQIDILPRHPAAVPESTHQRVTAAGQRFSVRLADCAAQAVGAG